MSYLLDAMNWSIYGFKKLLTMKDVCAARFVDCLSASKIQPISLRLVILPMLLIAGFLISCTKSSDAYTTVLVGTGTLESVENNFIAATTSYFSASLQSNPLAANTYTLTLWGGQRPGQATVVFSTMSFVTMTNQMITNSSYTYLYGWSDGSQYTRGQDSQLVSFDWSGCKSTMTFAIPPPNISTSTWTVPKIDSTTCSFLLSYESNKIFGLSFSTPTIVPGVWQ